MIGAVAVGLLAITQVSETAPVKRARLAPMAEAGTPPGPVTLSTPS